MFCNNQKTVPGIIDLLIYCSFGVTCVLSGELYSREWGGGGFYLRLKNISVSSRILHIKTVVLRVYVYAIKSIKTTNRRVGFEAA